MEGAVLGPIFEDEIRQFLTSVGFSNVPAPQQKFYLGGQEIDAFGRDGSFYVVVDAKTKTSLKKRGRKVRTYLSVINGYKDEVIKDIKRRYEPRHGYRGTAFIFWTKDVKIEKKHRDRAKALKIALRDDFDLKYYNDASEILRNKEVVRNSFLTDIRFQLPKLVVFPKRHTINVKAIRTTVEARTLYTFPIEVQHLLRLAYVFRVELNSILGTSYQRLLKGKKISKIRDYLEEGGYFPNNIIAVSKETLTFTPEEEEHDDAPFALGELRLPDKPCYIEIVDGQHRLYGYSNQTDKANDCLWVTIVEGLTEVDRARLFVTINKTQTKVPPDILWDLYQVTEPNSIFGKISKFVYELNDTDPFKDLISLPRVRSSSAYLSFSNFCGSLYKRSNLFSRYGSKTNFKEVMTAYFETISNDDELNVDWRTSISNWGKKGFVCTNNSIAVLLLLLAKILRKKQLPQSNKIHLWKKRLNKWALKPLKKYLSENAIEDETDAYGELRKKLTSEAAREDAANEIWAKSPISKLNAKVKK